MATVFLVLVVVLVVAALVFGVVTLLSGEDPGIAPVEPDGRAQPLPNNRSLTEGDLKQVRFDLTLRGYRMAQVDRVLRRTAYDLGYKDEMIAVLEAEVSALRDGRVEDAELLRKARETAGNPEPSPVRVNETPGLDVDAHAPGPDAHDEPPAAHAEEPGPDPEPEPDPQPDPLPREGSLLRRPEPAAADAEPAHGDAEAAHVDETQPADSSRHA